jgi:hypothetical protein
VDEGASRFREAAPGTGRLVREGIVAKRKADPHGPASPWYKVLNPDYSQKAGRGELFERRR